jgi:hypothetical protein
VGRGGQERRSLCSYKPRRLLCGHVNELFHPRKLVFAILGGFHVLGRIRVVLNLSRFTERNFKYIFLSITFHYISLPTSPQTLFHDPCIQRSQDQGVELSFLPHSIVNRYGKRRRLSASLRAFKRVISAVSEVGSWRAYLNNFSMRSI